MKEYKLTSKEFDEILKSNNISFKDAGLIVTKLNEMDASEMRKWVNSHKEEDYLQDHKESDLFISFNSEGIDYILMNCSRVRSRLDKFIQYYSTYSSVDIDVMELDSIREEVGLLLQSLSKRGVNYG